MTIKPFNPPKLHHRSVEFDGRLQTLRGKIASIRTARYFLLTASGRSAQLRLPIIYRLLQRALRGQHLVYRSQHIPELDLFGCQIAQLDGGIDQCQSQPGEPTFKPCRTCRVCPRPRQCRRRQGLLIDLRERQRIVIICHAALLLFHAKASDRYVVAAQRLFGVPFQNLRLTYRVNERDDIEDYFDVAFRK
ncbi:hypothetical protein [Pseudomonas sp. EA_65y_Pfl2_P78]|uniref:hypothetical protein n=1 Tax=Pseudomonas sp. EA_65y_Pfl2_P78 TaxID=3088695 RepID=UPI0030D98794